MIEDGDSNGLFSQIRRQLTYRDARPRMPAVTAHKSTQQIDAFDESGEPTVSTAIKVLTNCYCTGILTSDPVTQATLN